MTIQARFLRSPKFFAIFATSVAAILTACSGGFFGPTLIGSGVVRTEARPISGVHAVRLSGGGDLDIRQGPAESLSIEAEDNILPVIETTMNRDTLVIGTRWGTGELRANTLRYHLVVPDLRAVDLAGTGNIAIGPLTATDLSAIISGSGSLSIKQLQCRSLRVDLNGSGNVHARQVQTDRVATKISGSANVDITGQTNEQSIVIAGSGNYKARGLSSKKADVDVSGSGSATIACADSLKVSVSGSGNIAYAGSPTVTSSVSGAGSIEQKAR
jgi:hypothetical protein